MENLPAPGAATASPPADYDTGAITKLEGLEAVRKRPGMYIGDTMTYGLHHLVYEVVDNSVDEALAGHCTDIEVVIHVDDSLSVQDNGRGIPVGPHPDRSSRAWTRVDVVMTKLHAGGKFEQRRLQGLRRSARRRRLLRQRAVRVVQGARSSATARSTSRRTRAACPQARRWPRSARPTSAARTGLVQAGHHRSSRRRTSTSTRSRQRLRELAFLNAGLRIIITDERVGKEHDFKFDGGIVSFVEYINKAKQALHDKPIYFRTEKDGRGAGDRPAVERRLRRAHLHLRQQHQHPRGWHPPLRLQGGAHAHASTATPRRAGCGRT